MYRVAASGVSPTVGDLPPKGSMNENEYYVPEDPMEGLICDGCQ